MPPSLMPKSVSPLLRIAQRDLTAGEVQEAALSAGTLPVVARDDVRTSVPARAGGDPFQIDLSLALEPPASPLSPIQGVSYAGFTPSQRLAFLQWTSDPLKPAPAAFQRLYVANLEPGLLDPSGNRQAVHLELVRCALAPPWQNNEWLARALLFALWLGGSGAGIAEWLSSTTPPPAVIGLAAGLQALLNEPLRPAQVARIAAGWNLRNAGLPAEIVALRLTSLANALGASPLQIALERAPDGSAANRPWRSAHPSLRLSLPQPDIRPTLEPLLADMLEVYDPLVDVQDIDDFPTGPETAPGIEGLGWRLILEFGQSRSEFYDHVVQICQRMPDYAQIMDENRRLVHRVAFGKSDMRRFWRIWDYVQNWNATRAYLNGEELEKWKIWPYSQHLR